MAQEWDIKPRGNACSKCEETFDDNQSCFSVITYGEEGYARGDYCEKCWEAGLKSAPYFSAWQGVFKLPPPKAEEVLKKETAESLMRKLIQDEDESKINVIYILGVMLERKRLLAEKDVQIRDDGMLIRVYEYKKTGEIFLIADPKLQIDELEHVEDEVGAMLGWLPRKKDEGGDLKPEDAEAPEEGDEPDDDDDEYDDDEE